MFRVGLTGNIASGKSSVAEVWRRLGAPVIDADVLARNAVAPGTPGLASIVRAFGPDVLDAGGALDRGRLRRIVFRDPGARRRLEKIVHPEVAQLREREDAELERAGHRLVVHEIPLLFETGLDSEFDRVVLVDAPAEARLERLVQKRGLAEAEARSMIEAQMPAEEKRGRADLVIENAGGLRELERRATAVWRELEAVAAESNVEGTRR